MHLVTPTAVPRQAKTPAAEPPVRKRGLHLVPIEHLRNLIATYLAAVGVEWSHHVGDPFLPVFLVNKHASRSPKQPVFAERSVHAVSLRAVGTLQRLL